MVQTRKGFTSRIATSKPSTSRPKKPTLARSKSSVSTSAELDRSTITKRLIRRRVETQRAQNRTKKRTCEGTRVFNEFFPEDQEKSTPTAEKQEAGPIKMVSPLPSNIDDSTIEEEQKKV